MKFNFRKVASVIVCTAMLGSTMGLAAAANTYPAPFVSGGSSNVAIVYGASGASTDQQAAVDIGASLQTSVTTGTATGTVSLTGEGDKAPIDSATKLTMNQQLTTVKVTDITASDMPTLLKRMTYRSYDSNDYDYEQKITFYPNINVTHFASNDYKNKEPTVGISLTRTTNLLNYTIAFVKTPLSDVTTAGRLEDFENSKITILGKEYTILQAYNSTSAAASNSEVTKLVLMAGSATDIINMDEEQTKTVEGKSYAVKLTYVDSTKARFEVNGENSPDISNGGTWKMGDGTQIGVRSILYQGISGGVSKVEYTVGAEKLTLEQGQNLYLNDNSVDDVTVSISRSNSGARAGITKIVFTWVPNSATFITPEKSVEFPGLKSVKLVMTEFYTPKNEKITVTNSNQVVQLRAPIKSGDASIDLLFGNGTDFTYIGRSATNQLRTSNLSNIAYNRTIDEQFIASWASTTEAESYLLKATVRSASGVNYTKITDAVSGVDYCLDKKQADACTIGNIVLTMTSIDPSGSGVVNMTINSGGNFYKLYTKEGATITLPWHSTNPIYAAAAGLDGAINASNVSASTNTRAPTFRLVFREGDKNHNIEPAQSAGLTGVKGINLTLSWTSDGKTTVSAVGANGDWSGSNYFEQGSTQIYEGYLQSPLATKVLYYTAGTQDYADIFYHGSPESYAKIYVASKAIGTSAEAQTILPIADSEITDAAKAANLIVVGGSCINTVAAKLLGSDTPLCDAAFTTATGVGTDKFLIQTFANPYATGTNKIATLVAGYEAADTINAVNALKTKTSIDLSVAKKYTGTTAGDVTAA